MLEKRYNNIDISSDGSCNSDNVEINKRYDDINISQDPVKPTKCDTVDNTCTVSPIYKEFTVRWQDIIGIPSCIKDCDTLLEFIGSGGVESLVFNPLNGDLTLETSGDTFITSLDGRYILESEKGQPDGVATLDENGLVPLDQLPEIDSGEHNTSEYGLVGDQDGVNNRFSTLQEFVTGTSKLYINGVRQFRPDDYIESNDFQVILTVPPGATDNLTIDYTIKPII